MRLRRLASVLAGREDDIARRWLTQIACGAGEAELSAGDDARKAALFEIEEVLERLREGEIDRLAERFFAWGAAAAARGISFAETSRRAHLFEMAIVETLRAAGLSSGEVLDLYLAFSHLGHERSILLAEAYRREGERAASERAETIEVEMARLARDIAGRDRLCGLIGRSLPMQRVYERLAIAARTRDPVLLVGESGTGKELAARAIHALSGDPAERFIAVNCAALPRDLMESELFGHTAGAFSGARGEHLGVFRAASGGTLFLDELTELVPEAQAKLLRALQERAVRPVGALAEVPVAVRIVASTNRDLRESLAEGRLRRDLYYRLQSLVVTIPPLRERREDIPLLVRHFLARAEEEGMRCCRFGASREVLRLLSLHDWPGNVRELENAIRFACRLDRGPRLEASDLPAEIVAAAKKAEARARALGCDLETPAAPMGETASKSPSPSAAAPERSLMTIREAEREAIARALRATGGNKARAARLLSISRKQLYAKIREYGLDPRADLVPKELGERGRDDTR